MLRCVCYTAVEKISPVLLLVGNGGWAVYSSSLPLFPVPDQQSSAPTSALPFFLSRAKSENRLLKRKDTTTLRPASVPDFFVQARRSQPAARHSAALDAIAAMFGYSHTWRQGLTRRVWSDAKAPAETLPPLRFGKSLNEKDAIVISQILLVFSCDSRGFVGLLVSCCPKHRTKMMTMCIVLRCPALYEIAPHCS